MNIAKVFRAAAVVTALGAGVLQAGDMPVNTGKLGDQVFLMDQNKMTLYTFDKDAKGVSNCNGPCAAKWPPLLAKAGTKLPAGYSLISRADGSMQIAYKGHPLYLWIKDSKPGDMTGDGVKGVWHTARP